MEGFKVKKCITLNHGIASELPLIENAHDFRWCWYKQHPIADAAMQQRFKVLNLYHAKWPCTGL